MKIVFSYVDGGQHAVLGHVWHQKQEAFGEGAQKERYQRYLANAISGIAPDADECDRLLALISKIEGHEISEANWEGRDIDVFLRDGEAQIDILVNDDWVGKNDGRFQLKELKMVTQGWLEFLALPESVDSIVTVVLE